MNSSRFDVYTHRVFTRSWNRSLGFVKHVAGFSYTGFATKRLSGDACSNHFLQIKSCRCEQRAIFRLCWFASSKRELGYLSPADYK